MDHNQGYNTLARGHQSSFGNPSIVHFAFVREREKEREQSRAEQRGTWSVRALVCLVTKKLHKFAPKAIVELMKRSIHMNLCSIPSETRKSHTLGSITIAAGSKTITAIGAIYSIKFMEFNFSLQKKGGIKYNPIVNQT
ncbi:trypsin family protein with PDZ domain [Striga asiatica]|uniref:Trypsin family protein with PDZ domain n=1 Tax=Striga asiatica TaxID=4170 RepID=A0A5A7NZD3_STRAF|nr:trypsin family protein with PDZ domain [Striga asiatica]